VDIILKTSNLTKKYKDKVVVNKLNITINKGDIYGFIGRNGAGKTTTLKMIMGQAAANSGSIEVFEETISSNDYKYKSRIGLILENPTFYPKLTARENLEVYRRCMGVQNKKRIDEVLNLVDLSGEENKKVEKYSEGMKQRLGIARAILNTPEFLILDEPTNSLDPVGIGQIREIILKLNRERNTTVLICSHILSEIEHMATKIGIIHKGNLIEEVLYKELEEKNKAYLEIKVNDQKKAAIVLEQKFGINGYRVYEGDIIRIFDNSYEPEYVNKQMIEDGVLVKELKVNSETLEDYFFRVTGGEKSV
jgi:bacitracin transport system ATP-binding protein